jgi:hypothetical protein
MFVALADPYRPKAPISVPHCAFVARQVEPCQTSRARKKVQLLSPQGWFSHDLLKDFSTDLLGLHSQQQQKRCNGPAA